MSSFRLPHESTDAPVRPSGPTTFRATTAARTGRADDVQRTAQRRASARRTVSGVSVGLVVAAGVGIGGLTWAAQQASAGTTTATAQTGTTSTGTTTGTTTTSSTSNGSTSSSGSVTVTAVSGSTNADASTSAS